MGQSATRRVYFGEDRFGVLRRRLGWPPGHDNCRCTRRRDRGRYRGPVRPFPRINTQDTRSARPCRARPRSADLDRADLWRAALVVSMAAGQPQDHEALPAQRRIYGVCAGAIDRSLAPLARSGSAGDIPAYPVAGGGERSHLVLVAAGRCPAPSHPRPARGIARLADAGLNP
jgi:hypothetical protein